MAEPGSEDAFLRAVAGAPEREPPDGPLALKVLPGEFESDRERRERFLREARLHSVSAAAATARVSALHCATVN